MAGVPGRGGPPPKRSDQRRRRNAPKTPVTKVDGAHEVSIPKANPQWHPVAKAWFQSLALSGQAVFYEPSDWAVAVLVAESMSRDLNPQVVGITETGKVVRERIPLKGASLQAYLKAFTQLMATEGERRRMQIELQRPSETDEGGADVAWIDQYRQRQG